MDASQYKDYVLVFLFLKYISDKYAGQPFAPITIPAGAGFADMAALKGAKDIGDQINKAIIAPLVEANQQLTLYGQEKDATTSGLARMSMILHDNPTAEIAQGNTLSAPKFLEGASLKRFDYVVANPPFSDKRWSTGLDTLNDPHERFKHFGTPPDKQGDYAYLLHILRSLKSTGKGACILPHGVLFRGNAEAEIRKKLIRKGYLKAIIGLPANLFYGTGIPACLILLDKSEAHARKGIFMIDASKGFIKDGNKNRLRSRDIHQIVDAYRKGVAVDGYARSFSFEEIEKNDFNLNLPRYIDNRAAEDLQDIEAHLKGGIPQRDVDALEKYWQVCPNLRASLFNPLRDGYVALNSEERMADEGSNNPPSFISHSQLQAHPDLVSFTKNLEAHFTTWSTRQSAALKRLQSGFNPKDFIHDFSENLLQHYQQKNSSTDLKSPTSGFKSQLIDPYAVYQHLMDYWAEVLQDDAYLIALDGWKAATYRITETNKKTGKTKDKGWACDLVPKALIVARYFAAEQAAIESQQTELEALEAQRTELEEAHSGEDGAFAELDKINKAEVSKRLKELKANPGNANLPICPTEPEANPGISTPSLQAAEDPSPYNQPKTGEPKTEQLSEAAVLQEWLNLNTGETALKKAIKDAEVALDTLAYEKYPQLSEAEIQTLAVDDKWLATLQQRTHSELDRITQALTQRVKELAERYHAPLPKMTNRVSELELKVNAHLEKMGFAL